MRNRAKKTNDIRIILAINIALMVILVLVIGMWRFSWFGISERIGWGEYGNTQEEATANDELFSQYAAKVKNGESLNQQRTESASDVIEIRVVDDQNAIITIKTDYLSQVKNADTPDGYVRTDSAVLLSMKAPDDSYMQIEIDKDWFSVYAQNCVNNVYEDSNLNFGDTFDEGNSSLDTQAGVAVLNLRDPYLWTCLEKYTDYSLYYNDWTEYYLSGTDDESMIASEVIEAGAMSDIMIVDESVGSNDYKAGELVLEIQSDDTVVIGTESKYVVEALDNLFGVSLSLGRTDSDGEKFDEVCLDFYRVDDQRVRMTAVLSSNQRFVDDGDGCLRFESDTECLEFGDNPEYLLIDEDSVTFKLVAEGIAEKIKGCDYYEWVECSEYNVLAQGKISDAIDNGAKE